MRRALQRLSTVLAASLVAGVSWTFTAQAAGIVDVSRALPITSSGTFAVDRLRHHLLVAGGRHGAAYQTGLLVLNADGAVVKDLLPADAVTDVPIAPDGRTAWLTDATAPALWRLDLTTLVLTSAYTFLLDGSPTGVAVVNSRYVAVALAEHDSSAVVLLDLRTKALGGRVYIPPVPGASLWVRAIPETNRIVALTGLGTATVYDVTTGTPQIVGGPRPLPGCTRVTDVSVASDGHSMVPFCADQPTTVPLTQYKLPDLSVATSYPLPSSEGGTSHLSAAAFSSDDAYLAVGTNEPGRHFVLLHRTGTHWSGVYGKTFGADRQTADRGIQFSDDGTAAYSLVESLDANGVSTGVTLYTLPASPTPIARASSNLTVAAPASAPVNTSVAVSGTLRFSDNSSSSLPAGRQITIARTLNGHTVTVTETPDATGSSRFLNTPTAIGTATYVVTFPGDQLDTGSTATVTTHVSSAPERHLP